MLYLEIISELLNKGDTSENIIEILKYKNIFPVMKY